MVHDIAYIMSIILFTYCTVLCGCRYNNVNKCRHDFTCLWRLLQQCGATWHVLWLVSAFVPFDSKNTSWWCNIVSEEWRYVNNITNWMTLRFLYTMIRLLDAIKFIQTLPRGKNKGICSKFCSLTVRHILSPGTVSGPVRPSVGVRHLKFKLESHGRHSAYYWSTTWLRASKPLSNFGGFLRNSQNYASA